VTVSVRYLPDNRNPLWRHGGRWLVTAAQVALITVVALIVLSLVASVMLLHMIRRIGRR